ncbi:MAG: hypothetical protein K0R57_3194 [Paenibacillaceae bacterium]|nr:hypothetical protein [Paenibacillaceae bacterium]
MAYQAKVVEATLVSENKQNGFIEIVAELADRNRCRVTFEKDAQSGSYKPTHINRLYTVPCGICKKDFQCYCLDRYMDIIAVQALDLTGLTKVS